MHKDKAVLTRFGGLLLVKPIYFIVLLAYLGVAGASSEHEAMEWVQKMSRAMQELSYKGRFVFAHNNQLESMSILHVNDAAGQRERLVSLNGEAREILRDNKVLTCVWPSSRQVVVDQSNQSRVSPIWVPDDVKRLGKFYEFSLSGKDRIADNPAVIVSIKPKDQYRYGMKIWVHENNGLLLQSTLNDEQGNTTEQIMFTELSLLHYDDQKILSVLPEIDNGYALIRSHSGKASPMSHDQLKWQLTSPPDGFWIESALHKQMDADSEPTHQIVLTDGIASVSVFIEKTNANSLLGESSMGAVNAFGTRYNEYTITAIGEVPDITVKYIAQSIVYQD